MLSVTVIRNGVVDEMTLFKSDTVEERQKAENFFLDRCGEILTNWDEYTNDDKDAILDNGYESFGNGSICICTPDIAGDTKCDPDNVVLVFDPCEDSGCTCQTEPVYQTLSGVLDSGTAACPECGQDLTFNHVFIEK